MVAETCTLASVARNPNHSKNVVPYSPSPATSEIFFAPPFAATFSRARTWAMSDSTGRHKYWGRFERKARKRSAEVAEGVTTTLRALVNVAAACRASWEVSGPMAATIDVSLASEAATPATGWRAVSR